MLVKRDRQTIEPRFCYQDILQCIFMTGDSYTKSQDNGLYTVTWWVEHVELPPTIAEKQAKTTVGSCCTLMHISTQFTFGHVQRDVLSPAHMPGHTKDKEEKERLGTSMGLLACI